ncbi:MAG: hypothetical protein OEM90_21475 [Desulfobacteraceae bacterium]|nr:hypothetical protein [Desulfobacteraceae bacterium]
MKPYKTSFCRLSRCVPYLVAVFVAISLFWSPSISSGAQSTPVTFWGPEDFVRIDDGKIVFPFSRSLILY